MGKTVIKPKQGSLKLLSQAGTFANNIAYLTANVPSGYKFLCWTSCATNGFVGTAYATEPAFQSSNFWCENATGNFYAIYLVQYIGQ